MTNLTQSTQAQVRIAALAQHMAETNPDAAEELAKHLAHQVTQRKRVRGFGVVIRLNRITGRIEVHCGS